MIIVADENILAVNDSFQTFGELRLLPGREITSSDVKDADALIVRSITRVEKGLLAGSNVRFVATATSGTDHLDLQWLAESGIHVADAAGTNANAVVEYVLYALCDVLNVAAPDSLADAMSGRRLAVIGAAGHTGSRLLRLCREYGVDCVACDPFVSQLPAGMETVMRCDLEAALDCDVISLHVPLTSFGPHPTQNMIDAERISALHPGTVLINTARGGVVDTDALKQRILRSGDITAILDVYPGEPEIDRELCEVTAIATPHIAGYSVDAKMAATQRVLAAFCMYFDLPMFEAMSPVPAPSVEGLGQGTATRFSPAEVSREFCRQVQVTPADQALAPVFDALRRQLAQRRETGLNRAASPT